MTVTTRFAPSPTGLLPIDSVHTALLSWLCARHQCCLFVLRIEETNKERSTYGNVDAVFDGMLSLGLDSEKGPFFQTQRFLRFRGVIDQWLNEGTARMWSLVWLAIRMRWEAQSMAAQTESVGDAVVEFPVLRKSGP